MINSAVCEGCGDCSDQSNCVSIEPLDTPMGRKRQINQSSCNKDFSCLKGFCPSFVTIEGGQLRKKAAVQIVEKREDLPMPRVPSLTDQPWNIAVTGVGGTGVLTIGSLLGMAAHLDGGASMVLDMAGLAQKGGAVISHVRLARKPAQVSSPHIVAGSADLMIAADAVVAASRDGNVLCDSERTTAVMNSTTAPVAGFVRQRDLDFKSSALEQQVASAVNGREHFLPFAHYAVQQVGDSIATNVMMLGYAWQQGLVPLSLDAINQAIELNGVAIDANKSAFYWGRKLAIEPDSLKQAKVADAVVSFVAKPQTFKAIVQHRAAHLSLYQNDTLADRYRDLVHRFADACKSAGMDERLPGLVARHYAKLLAYKDEYEVARLYSTDTFKQQLQDSFEGDYRIRLHLAPPLLSRQGTDGRPVKRTFGPWILTLLKWLQHGKVLRGTALDVFGYSAERRAEQAWISHYESDIVKVMEHLASPKHQHQIATCEALLNIPDQIRGFGIVKQTAMDKALRERQLQISTLEQTPVAKASEAA